MQENGQLGEKLVILTVQSLAGWVCVPLTVVQYMYMHMLYMCSITYQPCKWSGHIMEVASIQLGPPRSFTSPKQREGGEAPSGWGGGATI